MKKIMLAAVAASFAIVAFAPEADAMRKRGGRGDNAAQQSNAFVKVEWARARAAGGYGNPFSALIDAISGTERPGQPERPGQVQRVITPQEALDIRNGSFLELF